MSSAVPLSMGRRLDVVRARGALILRWAAWNVFPLLGAGIVVALAVSPQGAELGRIAARQPWPSQVALGALLWIVALQFFLAGHVVARSGAARLRDLVEERVLPIGVARLWLRSLLPATLACSVGVVVFEAVHGPLGAMPWLAVWLPASVGAMTVIARHRVNSRRRWADVQAAAAIVLCVGTPLAPLLWLDGGLVAMSRHAGTLGIVAIGVGFWVLLLALLFVAFPLQAGWGNWAAAAPIVWMLAAFVVDPNRFPRGLDVPSLERTPLAQLRGAQRPTLVHHAVVRWLRQFESIPGDGPIPLILVSAEGGGIRAAYWTAEVLAHLNRITDGRLVRHAVAYSGVSGGAFGVTAFVMASRQPGLGPTELQGRLRALMREDYLAPLAGAMTLSEPLWQLLPWPGGSPAPRDRIFEAAWQTSWERHFGGAGFAQTFWQAFDVPSAAPPAPMIVLNTTNVETGKRVLIGNIGLTTQRQDFFEFHSLPGVAEVAPSMTVAEAAHLSARFPFLSPPAAIQSATPTGAASPAPSVALRTWGHLVDGGYFDNSGTVVIHDIVQDMHDLWRDAHLGNVHQTTVAGLDWERDSRLLRRLRVLVVVLRNDPAHGDRADRLDFPTMRADAALPSDADALGALYNAGGFLDWLPRLSPLAELWGPPSTMLAAREARGAASRRLLSTHLTDLNFSQQVQCEILDRARRGVPFELPIRYTAGCLNRSFSRYIEVSLADALELLREPPPNAPMPPAGDRFCPPWLARRDIALGWVLSPASAHAMNCAAAASEALREAADWLDPEGESARRSGSRPVVEAPKQGEFLHAAAVWRRGPPI